MDLTCYNSYYEVNLSVLEENFKKIFPLYRPGPGHPGSESGRLRHGRSENSPGF